jgi:glycosyltransferase involved in cell wall biosynthesis
VIVEAFIQQTPAIVRNLGGMPEIIAESGGGFAYNSDEELVELLEEVFTSPLKREKMGKSGYQTYQQKWTAEAYLKRYFEVIERKMPE